MTDFATSRRTMVDTQVRPSDVTKFPIIDAMLSVAREEFVPDAKRPVAYAEGDIALPDGRVILAPRCFSKMLDVAALSPSDVVLDLGCGYGYSTAVLAHMVEAVVSVEPDDALAKDAQRALSETGCDNAAVVSGALADGSSDGAPYDVIFTQGGVEIWPEALTDQLRDGGRAVGIWMQGHLGVVRLGHKIGGRMVWRDEFNATAPVLPGFEKDKAFAL